jgi:hypothetical protein
MEVTLPSGNTYLIRKANQRDYAPRGLIAISEEGTPEEKVRTYLAEHYDEVLDIEVRLLVNCVLDPRIVPGEALSDDTLSVRDLGDDRDPLLSAINEFSGLTVASKSREDAVPPAQLPDAGSDGGVLREASS